MSGFHKSTTAYLELDACESDKQMRADFVNGSKLLLDALRTGHGPARFAWQHRGNKATWQPTGSAAQRIDKIHERDEMAERLRVSRDPCPVCNTRGDIGCEHRRPM